MAEDQDQDTASNNTKSGDRDPPAREDDSSSSQKGQDEQDGKKDQDGKGGDEPAKPSPLKNPKVRIGLAVVGLILLVVGTLWFIHYWRHGRFVQKTNDAYLQADQVAISSKVPGYVEEVYVSDNQTVDVGTPLVRIDPRDTRARAEQAQAQVDQGLASMAQADAQIAQQRSQVAVADAQLQGAVSNLKHAQEEVDRYRPLVAEGAHSAEQLDRLLQTRDQAASQLAASRAQRESALRQDGTLRAQRQVAAAQVEQARAQQRQTESDLASTIVRSSIAGRVGDRTVRVGQYVQPATRLMSVVPIDQLYLVANFKETQIGLMRIGQSADIQVDALPGSVLHGEVQSFSPGTGAQFALLPPQNATGNFTKVVQRVPVRIQIDAGPEARRVLLAGLSATVEVDTLGAKKQRERAEDESDDSKDRRKDTHEQDVERDRRTQQPGPGK
ncbi:HlyD family efflux transporter periplasmic adaptor subunit [Xylophilus rhododendri]|uniref:HlyD family efflux transporter periplasmic adaptor subunit n=1 Tax=Xylophilus rhododendri TaxID=2697032 RepID=A0A857J4I1_9BURK|nr:HlyD family secretion protein [Xylophilus rhododendri]QHI98864.1 HlyD family efflux transporter periplasmic adaptor subunit [Xylophilus rhododendri]